MAKTTTTVTHPDGTVSKRTSQNAKYAFAVVVGPVNPTSRAAYLNRQRLDFLAEAEKIAAALKNPQIRIHNRGFNRAGEHSYHSHEAYLVGPRTTYRNGSYNTIEVRCDADGNHEQAVWDDAHGTFVKDANGETIRYEEPARVAVIREAEKRVADLLEYADKAATDMRAAARGDRGPKGNGYSVVRWSTRHDLAAKAADGEFSYFAEQGHEVSVVPVEVKA